MEMNTRIQVEHPVTEMVYDVDLVRQQILVAAGDKLEVKPRIPHGHAFEFRINAEDPANNFRPSPGKITSVHFPGGFGVRVDSHIYHSYSIPPYYDSLIAKLIVWGTDRNFCIRRAKRALDEFIVEGITTTIPFHQQVLDDESFKSGIFDTSFLEKFEYSS
jgi:acetyl-CoA carboxylase biotin carboxylase subunit